MYTDNYFNRFELAPEVAEALKKCKCIAYAETKEELQEMAYGPTHTSRYDVVYPIEGLGTVKEISLTFTKLETPDGLWLMTPNSVLSSGKITNYTALGRRRAEIRVGASYDAAVSDVRAACLDAAARVPGVLPDPAPIVYVDSYGESSISYIVRVWCRSEDYTDVYYGLTEGLKAAFDEHGVEMPYNHLNIHILDQTEQKEKQTV